MQVDIGVADEFAYIRCFGFHWNANSNPSRRKNSDRRAIDVSSERTVKPRVMHPSNL